ncbi:MAG: hypothetical protein SPK63_02380 [Eubacteriales bacterium]|nr:hypothetical protein [Eubacteriales bacterium]
MIILEHPLMSLIIALLVLIFFLVLFKILNYLDKVKEKSKPKEKKSDTKVESSEKSSSEKSDSSVKDAGSSSNSLAQDKSKVSGDTNYLYDRFVVSPTIDDKQVIDANICSAFLDIKKADEIKNKKLDIHVEPVVNLDKEEIQKNNEKQKLLNEISNMSKEMKLLMLEDILKRM